ncbi:MAG: tandem-95 repeat protein, partial [Aliifodinibius sp.]|nr:tandem-95 repeat protein [Fodinibius sp.]
MENTYTTDDINYGVYKLDIYVFLAANNTTLIMRHNNAPTLKDITDQQLVENSPFSLQLQADEADGDSIYYEAFNLPEGATFDKKTGYFSWTPTYEQSGVYKNVRFRVVELTGSNLSASDTIDLSVAHVNRLPDLPSLPDTTIEEQQLLTLSIPEGSDPDKEDQNNLTYRAETLPEGTQFDPMTREFSWTPTYEQSGLYTVDFLIDDGAGGIDREPVTITVKHVDRKPSIDPIADQTIDEVDTLTLTLTGTEPDSEDQDKISFVMENLPEGANFDPASRLFTWTPTYDQSGSYQNILATMIGGKLRDSTSFSIEVNHVNRAPVLAEISDQSVDENKVLSFKIEGSDPDVEDSGKLAYSATDLPQGATFNEDSLIFQWQPTYEQSGTYPDITFTVNDPSGLSDSKTISISVNHVNRAPTIAEVENKTVNENESLEFQLSATDPDKEDQGKLAFSAVGLPEGATLDSQTGAFQWVPTYEQSGEYPVTFMISDQEFTDSTQMQVSVLHVNRSPSLASIEPKTVDENQLLNFVIEGSDPDQEDQGLLSYSATDLPQGAVFDSTTRSLEWMPTYEQSGNYAVNFTVTDPAGLSDQKTANLTVNHVNRSPSLQPVAAQTVDENQPLTFQLVGEDFDQEDTGKLVYSMDNLPEGATVDPAAGTFSWTPTYEQSGEYTLTAQVQDASQLSATQPVTITVNHVNRPPEFTELPAQNGEENAVLQFSLQASDPDQEDT